jgi:hypothetical protein
MNPGYLSLILLVIALILCASGWMDVLLRSITHKVILLFFIAWLGLSRVTLTFSHAKVNLTFVLVLTLSALFVRKAAGPVQKLHLLSIGLLLGSFHFLLQEMYSMDPILVVSRPELDMAVFMGLMTSVLQRSAAEQIACLSIGLVMGEVFYAFVHKQVISVYLGSPTFQDKWWVTVFVSRTVSLFVQVVYLSCKGIFETWMTRKRGWRK